MGRGTQNIKCNRFIMFVYFKCPNQLCLGIWNPIGEDTTRVASVLPTCQRAVSYESMAKKYQLVLSVPAPAGLKGPSNTYCLSTGYIVWILYSICFSIGHTSTAIIKWKLEHYRRFIAYCHYLIFVLWPSRKGLWKPAIFLLGE